MDSEYGTRLSVRLAYLKLYDSSTDEPALFIGPFEGTNDAIEHRATYDELLGAEIIHDDPGAELLRHSESGYILLSPRGHRQLNEFGS